MKFMTSVPLTRENISSLAQSATTGTKQCLSSVEASSTAQQAGKLDGLLVLDRSSDLEALLLTLCTIALIVLSK